jgi:hypothetical protein
MSTKAQQLSERLCGSLPIFGNPLRFPKRRKMTTSRK